MKKTVLAIIAGMVCAISFACISGGGDFSGESGNTTGAENMPNFFQGGNNEADYSVYLVEDVDYLAYDFRYLKWGSSTTKGLRLFLRGSPNKTLAYIAEVNGASHISSPEFTNNDGSVTFSTIVYNRKTVHLPLRVKVGLIQGKFNVGADKFDFCNYVFQTYYSEILGAWRTYVRNVVSDFSLVLQYQVAGASSWKTVSRTKFSDIQQSVFQWQKSSEEVQVSKPKYYFLNGKIDGNFPAGTTLLIRIIAESISNDSPTDIEENLTGWESFGSEQLWTKKMTDTLWPEGSVKFINGFSPGLNTLYAFDDESGELNWCPLQWMAVTIGEGRKPE